MIWVATGSALQNMNVADVLSITIVKMQSLTCRSSIGLNKRRCPFRLYFLTVCALILTRMYVFVFGAGNLVGFCPSFAFCAVCVFFSEQVRLNCGALFTSEQVLYIAAPSTSIEIHMILPWALSILLLQV